MENPRLLLCRPEGPNVFLPGLSSTLIPVLVVLALVPGSLMAREAGSHTVYETSFSGEREGDSPEDAVGPRRLARDGMHAADQERQGEITGQVRNRRTGNPLSAIQVSVPDLELGALTDSDGRFRIASVPAGQHTVQAQGLGYRSAVQEVQVGDGESVVIDFELEEAALALDELVVTGTAGQARRREVGNVVGQINLDDQLQRPLDVEQALQAQVPGMQVMETAASSGNSRLIRLRGNSSVHMGNEPLIYIDGVRMASEPYGNVRAPVSARQWDRANASHNALGEINPEDIERIEVVKGAAATTLYGSEASAGVIQIFTRRGLRGDRARWTFQVDQGMKRLQPIAPAPDRYLRLDQGFLERGWRQRYAIQVSGAATEDTRYFLSASLLEDNGVVITDGQEGYNLRGNFDFSPLPDLNVSWNTSYTDRAIRNYPSGPNAEGLEINLFRAPLNYYGTDDVTVIREAVESQRYLTDHGALASGLTLAYQPIDRLSARATVGLHRVGTEMSIAFPFGHRTRPFGHRYAEHRVIETLTLDYVATYQVNPARDFRVSLSAGGQAIDRRDRKVAGYGETFGGPGEPTVESAATTIAFEQALRVINAGVFLQTLFDWRDRYFLTTGVRFDGNSAFGRDLGITAYPKVSASYVVSDEAFWPQTLGEFKLRAALGESGRAPGAFDAVRTWQAVGWVGNPAFAPGNVGNPELGPERTRELELGFDGSILDDRLGMEFTYYHQTTRDALFDVRQAPSQGFVGSQLENVGELRNTGLELSLNSRLLERPNLEWRVGLSVATNYSKVLAMGAADEFVVGQEANAGDHGRIMEGQPVPVIVGPLVRNRDAIAEPDIVEEHIFGPNHPTHTIGFSTDLSLPAGILLSGRAEFLGGHYIIDGGNMSNTPRGTPLPPLCRGPGGPSELLEAGRREELTAYERAWCDWQNAPAGGTIYPGDVLKIRNVSVQFPLPALGALTGLTLSGQVNNVRVWKHPEFLWLDPELIGNAPDDHSILRATWNKVPAPMTFGLSLRAVF